MIIAISLLLAVQSPASDTLHLSLQAALDRARQHNPTLLAERAEARGAAQDPLDASRAFLPNVQFDLQGLRTTDPVGAFGLKLRQENFQAEDLSLDALNRPNPYGGWNSVATVELPILAPQGLFGYTAARRGATARAAAAERATGATTFIVTRAYWDVHLAARRAATLEIALQAARAHASQAQALQEQGLVTGLDARMARVQSAAVETRLLAASAEAENASSALRALLALADSQPVVLTDSLEGVGNAECDSTAAECSTGERGDLAALKLGSDAASAMIRSAWSKNLPSIALFGSFGYYGRSAPWGDGSGDWTIGIGLRWNLFPGLSGVGAVRRAKAEHAAAVARQEAAERQATLEVMSAHRMLAAANQAVVVAEAGNREAQEALEQARLRYSTGAAPITELLDVQAAATQATLNMHTARRDLFVAKAGLDFAYGVNDR
jgi:outer membrane protein TolC